MDQNRLAIVVPCYNEEAVLPTTLATLLDCLQTLIQDKKIAADSFLYCVDDGSHDKTWAIIADWHTRFPQVKGLKLTKNMGHQNAVLAGLMTVREKVDCAITIDADLQDDVAAMKGMIERYQAGDEIVYGARKQREQDTLFKRFSANIYYKLLKKSGAQIIINHADFRLLSKRVLQTLDQYKERNLFLRGIIPLMGYRASVVYYDRKSRMAGVTKYTLRKMIALAWDGLTSFSHLPLDFILVLGVTSFFLSLFMIAWVLGAKLTAHSAPGWASIMIPICFMGGVQLLSLGIIGEYIAKIYLEVKQRPLFIIDKEIT